MSAGEHIINVTAVNGLGSVHSMMSTTVLYDVRVRNISARLVILGSPVIIWLEISGTREFTFVMNYGDGVTETFTTYANSTSIVPIENNSDSRTVYQVTFNHTYAAAGSYQIAINVSNEVSHADVMLTTAVGREPSDVVMTTNSTTMPLSSASVVMVTASLTNGQDLQFIWSCDMCISQQHVNRLAEMFFGDGLR